MVSSLIGFGLPASGVLQAHDVEPVEVHALF